LGESWFKTGARLFAIVMGLLALGLFLARAPLGLCLVVVLGTIVLVALSLRPVLALYLLAFSIPFGSLYELSLGGVTVGTSELLVLALVTAWLLRMMAFRRIRVARSRLTGALLCYLGALFISIWPARNLAPALKELAKWIEFLLVYLFITSELGQTQLQVLIGALLLAGTFEGALGIYQFLRQVGPPGFVLFGRYMRAYGTFLQPNPFGGYMGLLLPLAYTTVFARWRDALNAFRGRALGSATLWGLALLASAVMSAGLVMSWSRGALLGFGAGVALVGLALGRKAAPAVLVVALILILLGPMWLAMLPQGLVGRLTDAAQYVGKDLMAVEVTDESFALIERAAHWYAAWRLFDQRPWLGVGTGQYATVYPSVALPRWQDPLGHAHNYYLNVLAEGGLVGLAAYLIFVLTALGIAWRATGREHSWRRGLALAALGMLGHLLVHSVFDNLYVHEMYLLVAVFLGMVASLANRDCKGEAFAGHEGHKRAQSDANASPLHRMRNPLALR
jgi:O-antigen ligase